MALKARPKEIHDYAEDGIKLHRKRHASTATGVIELMEQPEDAELLAPLVIEDILIRLLRSPIGIRVARIGLAESNVHGVG